MSADLGQCSGMSADLGQCSGMSPERLSLRIQTMLLYTPLSADEAERAISGLGFADGEIFFVDNPDPHEAQEDAVWVEIEVPDRDIASFEQDKTPKLCYREFVVPGSFASRFPARRSDVSRSH
jgi:hypothetical protein